MKTEKLESWKNSGDSQKRVNLCNFLLIAVLENHYNFLLQCAILLKMTLIENIEL